MKKCIRYAVSKRLGHSSKKIARRILPDVKNWLRNGRADNVCDQGHKGETDHLRSTASLRQARTGGDFHKMHSQSRQTEQERVWLVGSAQKRA